MFSLDTHSPELQFTTRSSLQALLKRRRRPPVNATETCNDWLYSTEESEKQPKYAQNRDQREDFTYSQKYFHIDDGNLYSVFSPLQGRTYGMKPSFLRKQKCTVQECHGRGRKSLRKGLKFHNFLPSESVTSQKDDSIKEDQWKVHSECKLREEHGTKQIMVSNWFQNVRQFRENDMNLESQSSSSTRDSGDNCQGTTKTSTDVCNFQTPLPSALSPTNGNMQTRESCDSLIANKRHNLVTSANKRSFLNSLLHSVASPQTAEESAKASDAASQMIVPNRENKHRRKPNQTRRVVPYTKYLSLMEETDVSPLDLSVHPAVGPNSVKKEEKRSNIIPSSAASSSTKDTSSRNSTSSGKHVPNIQPARNQGAIYAINNQNNLSRILPAVPAYVYPVSLQKIAPQIPAGTSNSSQSSQTFHFQYKTQPSNSTAYNQRLDETMKQQQNMVLHSSSSKSKARRKSQRSVIKQKLEDTFRQNGFLVKTKQVSDGDATFCKFRQLRKYTRYYLKSWQQHLPDEVHKMWKGFLPPKTVLPPSSANSHNPRENPMGQ